MRKGQYIAIAVSAALIFVLYFCINTIPPVPTNDNNGKHNNGYTATTVANSAAMQAAYNEFFDRVKKGLSAKESEEITGIEKEIAGKTDSVKMTVTFKKLADFWDGHQQPVISAYYYSLIGKLDNSEKNLTFAARLFLRLMESESSRQLQAWEAGQAAGCLELCLALDSSNESTKLDLATVYMERTGEPMKGVQLLLGIVREKPLDIPANLLLGRMSLQSGQLEKAIGRFETVLKQDSLHKEALYYLAMTYKQKGDSHRAIDLLEKCKRLVNDPEFDKRVNDEINLLK